jgi:hypothetical protein
MNPLPLCIQATLWQAYSFNLFFRTHDSAVVVIVVGVGNGVSAAAAAAVFVVV